MEKQLKKDNTEITTTGTDPNGLLDYDMGKVLHHPTMIMLWGDGGRLDRNRY